MLDKARITNKGLAWDAASYMSAWLFDEAIPFWLENGVDRKRGGFVESMTLDGIPMDPGFKRTRVTARQVYVFSHAALQGSHGCADAAEHGMRFLLDHHRGDAPGEWLRLVTSEGKPLDETPDLYDIAFALFALAWWYRLCPDRAIIRLARQTIDNLPALRHPTGSGFCAAADMSGPHQQNPHMHLLEALVELFKASRDDFFLDEAAKIYQLFVSCFLVDGTLREFFCADWAPAEGLQGRLVEPGHMAEWAWILRHYGEIADVNVTGLVEAMMSIVIDASDARSDGLLPDMILDNGQMHRDDTRLWPQTELLKGLVALSEMTGVDTRGRIEACWNRLFSRFLEPAPKGCWQDHFDAHGSLIVNRVPASSLYHLSLGLNEVIRISNK